MAAYPLDSWKGILPLLDSWQALTSAQRQEALSLPDTYVNPVYNFSALMGLDPVLDQRLFETDAGGRKRPTPGCKRIKNFIQRLGAWCGPDRIDIGRFVDLYTTYAQRYALTGSRGLSQVAVTAAYDKSLEQGRFTRKLLDSPSRARFLESVGGWVPEGIELTEARFHAIKGWLEKSLAQPAATFVLKPSSFPPAGGEVAPEEILYLALAYGAVVLGRMPDTLQPFVRVVEPREVKIQDPSRLAFPAFTSKESWSRPFLLEDMEAYLRALKTDPAPLLSDAISVPIAHHRKVARTFGPLPYAPGPAGFTEESRARTAWWMLQNLKLIEASGRSRKTWRAHAGERAAAWLGAERKSRLEDVLALAPCGTRKRHPLHARFAWLGDFEANPFPYSALNVRLFDWMDAFFSRLEAPTDWNIAVAAARDGANPLLADLEADMHLLGDWGRWESTPQQTYVSLLHQYAGSLASLGALAIHRNAEGNLGVSLSEVGLWLYGRLDRWSLPQAARPVAVVGGDFTVTLLEAGPDFLLELRAFAEPVAAGGNGSAWRITRRKVQEAAHRGITAEGMLKTLREWSKHALPANVIHEIEAWAGARRGMRLAEAVLVEGEDALALAEVFSAFPKDFERISPTVLKAKAGTKRAALLKKLAKKGFFPE
jgi:Helicase conserved C-terminal domain